MNDKFNRRTEKKCSESIFITKHMKKKTDKWKKNRTHKNTNENQTKTSRNRNDNRWILDKTPAYVCDSNTVFCNYEWTD